jgi:hypothetical protein
MFRRIVLQLLIPLLLLPGMAHSHAGASAHDPSGLDRPPHFHLRSFYLLWQQYRSDQDPDSRHGRDEGNDVSQRGRPVDHDDDAVYLPHSVLLGWHIDSHVSPIDQSALVMLAGMVCRSGTVFVSIPPHDCSLPVFHGSSYPVYLRSLALLI